MGVGGISLRSNGHVLLSRHTLLLQHFGLFSAGGWVAAKLHGFNCIHLKFMDITPFKKVNICLSKFEVVSSRLSITVTFIKLGADSHFTL